jgi:hypothetical protein
MPALERYDGPKFRVLRKFLREQPEQAAHLTIYILSAKFGLIPADQPIPYYDQVMDEERASQLYVETIGRFQDVVEPASFSRIFMNMGKVYQKALEGYEQFISPSSELVVAQGSQFQRQFQLFTWLNNS